MACCRAGGGGSDTSVVTVAASSTNRMRTVPPPETSMPPGGRAPVRVTTGGAPRSAKLSGTGSAETGPFQGCSSAPSQIAQTKGSPTWSMVFHRSRSSASLMAASHASSRVKATLAGPAKGCAGEVGSRLSRDAVPSENAAAGRVLIGAPIRRRSTARVWHARCAFSPRARQRGERAAPSARRGAARRSRRCVNGGGNMYRGGGAKMYHGLGGSLSA